MMSSAKPFWLDPNSLWLVQERFGGAEVLSSREEVLRFACAQAPSDGLYLELGVASGDSLRFLAAAFPRKQFLGFDSFEGLPEAWVRGDNRVWKGAFRQEHLPSVPPNAQLVPGWFRDTLPPFSKKPVAFLHVDCDLYSSTREALEMLDIGPGAVIAFDEFYNYPGFEEHEFKAFGEFLLKKRFKAKAIAYNAVHEQAAFLLS